jgi:hypothetical protein
VRRLLLALVVVVLCGAPARSGDPWKWDPRERREAKEGERSFEEGEETRSSHAEIQKTVKDELRTLSYRIVRETLAVEKGRATKERVAVERWRLVVDGKEDECLKGRSVVVEVKGDHREAKVEGDVESISAAALEWIEKTLARDDDPLARAALLPKDPVADGGTWSPDPEALASALLPGITIDPAESKCEGKLVLGQAVEGRHQGSLKISAKLKLKNVPGTNDAWSEGGVLTFGLTGEGSLEPKLRRQGTWTGEAKLSGNVRDPDGAVLYALSLQMESKTRSGELAQGDGLTPPTGR